MELTETDWAYLAGLIDGGGSFILRSERRLVRLRVYSNFDLSFLPARYGAGRASPTKPYTDRRGVRRTPWTWTVNSATELAHVLDGAMPFMVTRRDQAERVRAFVRIYRHAGGPTSPARIDAFDALHDLNT